MALYAIGDLHLSLGTNKPMDVFGPKWANYVERIRENFSKLNDDDVIVIAGDISWGMSLEQSLPDFQFIDALPGRKILLKGNHDYWWGTASKMKKVFCRARHHNARYPLQQRLFLRRPRHLRHARLVL